MILLAYWYNLVKIWSPAWKYDETWMDTPLCTQGVLGPMKGWKTNPLREVDASCLVVAGGCYMTAFGALPRYVPDNHDTWQKFLDEQNTGRWATGSNDNTRALSWISMPKNMRA